VILLKSRDAFTLVEVLVAASIMLIGILLNFRQIEFVQSNSARAIARVEFSLLQSQLVQSFNSTTCKGAFFGVADSSISALSTAADLTNNTAISATETT
jgi:prepilin-type N-terminal cleavage/methylation domain-containing protein